MLRAFRTSACLAALIALLTVPATAQEVTIEGLRAAYPPNVEALDPGFHWAPEFSREVVTPERARVPLRTDWPDVAGLDASPVTFGVPFADGALASPQNARLITADGTPVPADLRTTATWWREDGPVRWMLVSATLERGQDYFIEYGTEVEAFEADGMTVSETPDAITINTGPLQATISKTRPTLLHSATVAGEEIVTPEAAAASLPAVVGGDGTEYPASADGFSVSITRQGANETVIRREGWYTSAAGEPYCQFITYTWFRAGSASVRHDHTLVVAFDTSSNQIRDIRLAVPVEGGVANAALSSGESVDLAANALPARVVQTGLDTCIVTSAATAPVEGTRSGGWAGARAADEAGAFVSIRDFAEQFPMELEVTEGAIVAHLWPAHDAPVLDFTPSAVMGAEYPGDRVFWQDFYRGGLDAWTNGYGIGKTHNLQLDFFGTDAAARSAAQAAATACDTPVLACADPEYAAQTWAFGRVAAADPEQFPEVEALVDAIMHRKYWLRDRLGNYGWINFGDMNYGLSSATNPETITYVHWRHWAQMFYGGPNVFPLLYMRSGRRDAWDFHRVNSRHIMDIDICHLDSDESLDFRFPKFKGGRYGGNGGVCHYGANIYPLGPDCHVRFMLADYYLNGNPRAWEVFREFADHQAGRRHERANNIYVHRQTGGGMRMFIEAYEASWDPEYLSCAHQLADILYGAQQKLGTTRYDDVYMNEGKVKYYQLTGDERMRDLFVNDMRVLSQRRDADVFADTRHTTLWGLSHAYWFTGEESLLPYAAWQFKVAVERVPTTGEDHEIGAIAWTFEHAYESTLGNQLPTFAALMRDVPDMPQGAGPTATGSGPIYLQEAEDAEQFVRLKIELYRGIPGLGAAPFSNWQEWVERLPAEDRPALRVLGPDAQEISRVDLLTGVTTTPALAADTGATEGRMDLRIPADGQTGTYCIVPASQIAPVRVTVLETSMPKVVHGTGDAWVAAASETFLVPAGTGPFSLSVKSLTMRTDVRVTVRNADGEDVAERVWSVTSDCRQDYERIELDAGQPAEDQAWTISFLAPTASYLRFEGVPNIVAAGAGALFIPDYIVEMPPVPLPTGDGPTLVESPLGGGQALSLPTGVGLALKSPDGTPLMNETEGTIEMWVRDTRQHDDLHNRSLIRSGPLQLYRRISVGTYFYIGAPGHQTGLVLPQDRWVHFAATWRPSTRDEGATEVALYIDGVRVETSFNRHIQPEPGWAAPELLIPADAYAGLFVDELRVSDVARYEGNFDRPEAPFDPDANTLILSHFEDDTALVRGAQVQWETR